ncbi:MAG: PIN domain-containing protein [Nostoc sp.]|uniref:type II toxin-antitoxin system VapC family toxin n=1 Tax=Nostoc sp. TaxID=1180 RepID=UPI002FFBCAAF
MRAKLFIDTWGWLTLHDKSERYHQEAREAYQRTIAQNGQIYTTDYVLDETITFFFRRLPAPLANQSMKVLLSAFSAENFYLIRITEERFSLTEVLRSKFIDKPLISFTDLTSVVIMQEFGITTILTEDAHFIQVGMGFQLVP